jgi:hypothetical protein
MMGGRALAALGAAVVLLTHTGVAGAQSPPPTGRPTGPPAQTPSTPARPGSVGRHVIQGEVVSVHAQAGQVRVRTPDGATFDFPFPQAVLSAMVPGQRVTVEMTIRAQ